MSSQKEGRKLPGIGLRIIKSFVGVLLCYVVDYFRGGAGIVFYSQLAVLWCMQDYVSETIGKAKQRTIGTVIGALYGLIVILLFGSSSFLPVVISLFIIVILYTTVLINKKQASYFSCVVFLSIVVNHIGDANPYLFVWNRFLDTMLGIGLGVFVNCFSLPRKKNRDILFISGLDDTLLSKNDNMTAYSRVELNRMIEDGAKFTISTVRTPGSLMAPLRDITLKLPVIVMDGAALFNIQDKKYEYVYVISSDQTKEIIRLLENEAVPYFANVIIDDMLVIYYQEAKDEVYNHVIGTLRKSPYRNYVKRPVPETEQVVYFMILDKKDTVDTLYEKLCLEGFDKKLKIVHYDSLDYEGYSYIKIYNKNAKKENMLEYLKNSLEINHIISFGTIPGRYTYTITPGDSNAVVKLMKKEYEPIRKRRKDRMEHDKL